MYMFIYKLGVYFRFLLTTYKILRNYVLYFKIYICNINHFVDSKVHTSDLTVKPTTLCFS